MVSAIPANLKETPLVDVQNLHVRFGRQQVLRGINVSVPKKQTLVVIGESGCGKTVFLKSLIGLTRPSTGSVSFDGQDLVSMSEKVLTTQRMRFGYLFQGAALFDSLTVAQNVAFPLKEHTEKTPEEIHEVVREKTAEVGLGEDVLSKRPAELSGGMMNQLRSQRPRAATGQAK